MQMTVSLEGRRETAEACLIARARAGDSAAFGDLYAKYERAVFRYAYHLLASRDDADDVKQETFVRAYQNLAGFRGDSSLYTWLLRICGNLCRDRAKSWERRCVTYAPTAGDQEICGSLHGANPEDTVLKSATADLIVGALQALPAQHREVLVLHEIEGHDYNTIGEIFACSPASVKLRVFRARKLLRQRVQSILNVR